MARLRILIAEDEAIIRLDLKEMLVELGHVAALGLAIRVWPWRRRRSKFRVG